MNGARTGGEIKHKRAELCLKAFISILFLEQSVTILTLLHAKRLRRRRMSKC